MIPYDIDFNFTPGQWSFKERKIIRKFYHEYLPIHPSSTQFDEEWWKHYRTIKRPGLKMQIIKLRPDQHLNQTIDIHSIYHPNQTEIEGFLNETYQNTVPLGVNEGYEILADQNSITIKCHSYFGVLHAIKTILQMSYVDSLDNYRHSACLPFLPLHIIDKPRFKYRGLLIDTGRYYYPVDYIKSIIRGICLLKMNAIHWHITDDQSFPLEVFQFPELHKKGGSHLGYIHNNIKLPKNTYYTQNEIKDIVKYAHDRGIRIIPEVDMPGHTRSWGIGYPELNPNCPNFKSQSFNLFNLEYSMSIPLDISNDLTLKVVRAVIETLVSLFPDPFIHLGGDEVVMNCWKEDKEFMKRIKSQLKASSKQNGDEDDINIQSLTSGFYRYLKYLFNSNFPDKRWILWEDAIEMLHNPDHEPLEDDDSILDHNKNIIYQVWKGEDEIKNRLIPNNQNFIYSFEQYLDPSYQRCLEACAWEMVTNQNINATEKDGINQHERGFPDRVWYRLIALSEKMWTSPNTNPNVILSSTNIINRAKYIAKILSMMNVNIGSNTFDRIEFNHHDLNE
eukprot:gene5321-6627_t